jgi:hypothetical protein
MTKEEKKNQESPYKNFTHTAGRNIIATLEHFVVYSLLTFGTPQPPHVGQFPHLGPLAFFFFFFFFENWPVKKW